jgi:hypothetical protein
MKKRLIRWTVRFLAYLLYSKEQWERLGTCIDSVSSCVGIPVYGPDQNRYGREARRDAAVHVAQSLVTGLSDSQINLGCELAYWWRRNASAA